jgi:glycosyltransferase involved in cell wall biosynthesis
VKILQLNPAFYPAFAYGGTVNTSYLVSKVLAKRSHDVTVFTSDTIDRHTRQRDLYLEHEGIKIHYFRNVSNLLAWHRYLFYPGLVRALRDHIQEFDIVHLRGARNFQNIVAAHYANKYGIPYVIQPHGSLPLLSGKQHLKRMYDIVWGDNVLKNAKGLIVATSQEAEQAIKLGVDENRVYIIPNGIDLSQYETVPPQGEFRALHNISPRANLILYLGRLHPIKGVDLLIRAFEIVSKEIDNCVLVIAGPDDGSLSSLKELAEELMLCNKVLFTGSIYGREKLSAYVDADVYVLPSIYESFSNTVLEAWACGTPVIVTESCAISAVAHKAGVVVKRDPDKLADSIRKIILDDALSRNCCVNGKTLIENEFNIESVVTKIEGCYRQLIRNKMENDHL